MLRFILNRAPIVAPVVISYHVTARDVAWSIVTFMRCGVALVFVTVASSSPSPTHKPLTSAVHTDASEEPPKVERSLEVDPQEHHTKSM